MNNLTHQQLLRDYVEGRSEAAFADLVRRHVDFVYSAALRILRNPHLAEDVTQSVFVALAQNARQLTNRPILSGWLHRTVQNLAANAIRSEVRRRAREQEAAMMNQSLPAESEPLWQQIAPHLDVALSELSEPDREALLSRYFEHKTAREIAQAFGISDEAAQKRVARAVERLRQFFAKRGIIVGANGLVVLIAGNAVQAAPAGLASTISSAIPLVGTALSTTLTATASQAIAMTTLQKTVIATVLTAAIGTGVYQGADNSKLRDHVQTLERQHAPLVDASNQLAALQAENESLKSRQGGRELLQLRGEVARLRDAASRAIRAEAEVAQLKSALESRQGSIATTAAAAPDASSTALLAFLGEAVPPPRDMNPAYTKEGLLSAIHQAAQLANVPLKQVEIETSEFPFLVGLVCDNETDFEKLKAQLKNMPNYDYHGGSSSHGTYAFNMIPYSSWPSDAAQRISRRTLVRGQMLHQQLFRR